VAAATAPAGFVFIPVAVLLWLLLAWLTAEEPEAGRGFFLAGIVVIPMLAVPVVALVRASGDVLNPRFEHLVSRPQDVTIMRLTGAALRWINRFMLVFGTAAVVTGEVAAVSGAAGSNGDALELYLTLMALSWLVGLSVSLGAIRAIRRR
jgi:hypothetical protein